MSGIRMATSTDISRLQEIRAAVRENVLSNPALVSLADYEAHIHGRGRTWVAEHDGHIVGFTSADRETASIWALFVDPAHAGRGHGRRLLDRAVDGLGAAGWTVTGTTASGELKFELRRGGA
jgi:GNAT superfamily N-acetyltransferase